MHKTLVMDYNVILIYTSLDWPSLLVLLVFQNIENISEAHEMIWLLDAKEYA